MTTGTAISALTATTSLAEADVFPLTVTASTVNRKITRADLRKSLIASPTTGQLVSWNGTDLVGIATPTAGQILQNNGTVWAGAPSSPTDMSDLRYDSTALAWVAKNNSVGPSGYCVINTSRYTALMPSANTITMSNTAGISVGSPVRFVISGASYYGMVTTVNTNTSIVFSGPAINGTMTSLAIGSMEMVNQKEININATGYANSTGDILASVGNQYIKWNLPKSYCVYLSATHQTATAPTIAMKINGTSLGNIVLSSTPGTWTNQTSFSSATYDINFGESIEINVVSAVASSNYLSLLATFVVE